MTTSGEKIIKPDIAIALSILFLERDRDGRVTKKGVVGERGGLRGGEWKGEGKVEEDEMEGEGEGEKRRSQRKMKGNCEDIKGKGAGTRCHAKTSKNMVYFHGGNSTPQPQSLRAKLS